MPTTFTSPAVFYAPHADDETLSMGVDIGNHLVAGRDVVVVLVTQSASVGMLGLLNGAVVDPVSGVRHDPVREQYLGPLTDGRLTADVVGQARVREWRSACGVYDAFGGGRLAVVALGRPEGLTSADVQDVVRDVEAQHPRASHKAMSWTDPHPDHAACGSALRSLRDDGTITDARFYVQRNHLDVARAQGLVVHDVPPAEGVADAVRRACACYRAWNPAAGSYGFGYRSVRALFDATLAAPASSVHA